MSYLSLFQIYLVIFLVSSLILVTRSNKVNWAFVWDMEGVIWL